MPQLSRMVNRSKINDYFLDLAHLNAAACHLSYSKRGARRETRAAGRIVPTGRTVSKAPAVFGAFRHIFGFCAKILYSIATLIDTRTAG